MVRDLIVLIFKRSGMSLVVLIGVLLFGVVAARSEQFSAHLVIAPRVGTSSVPAGRLRVLENKVRLETPELADGFFLIDGAAPAAYFVRPAAGIFMDARESSWLTRMFVPVDPANPCRQWQAMARLAGITEQGDWRCERMGEETIGIRSTVRFRAIRPSGGVLLGWIDASRKFPLRVQTEDGSIISAENLQDQPQSPELFELPSGLRKFDPQALIQQIKQSDVWVEGPEGGVPLRER